MMKLAWVLIIKPNSLWVQVMRSKHGCVDNIIPGDRIRSKASNAWTGIVQIWPQFKQIFIWRLGDSHIVRIWLDHWFEGEE